MGPELSVRQLAEIAKQLYAAPTPVQTAEEAIEYARWHLDAHYGGVTLVRRGGRLETIAASDPLVQRVDVLQYELGEGTYRDSSWRGETLMSGDLAVDSR